MPFIAQWRRDVIEKYGLEGLATIEPGDRCYVFYKWLMQEWCRAPKWRTAHRLLREAVDKSMQMTGGDDDDAAALLLAWQVFFQLEVIPYELKKREENGDV